MKQEEKVLKIYHLSHPTLLTEWTAILGDKYQGSLSVSWKVVDDWASADVIVWDGVITPKLSPYLESILNALVDKKTLLLVGEAQTLLRDHSIVQLVATEKVQCVEVPGWSALPEDILNAIEQCHKKMNHV